MKARSKSCSYDLPLKYTIQHTINRQFTYDFPRKELGFDAQPWDPNYTYNIPEGTGGEVSLPADPAVVPSPGKRQHFFLSYNI